MNGLGQRPMTGAEAASREASLNAVHDDLLTVRELVTQLDATVRTLQDHLMGAQPMLNEQIERDVPEKPPHSGMIPAMCELGAFTIHDLRRLQERLNQICHELGQGRER